jgi:7-cyano-7-deazaguanine synthase
VRDVHAAVALLSGGLDSVVAAELWLEQGHRIIRCLTFDYGQRAAAMELEAAQRFTKRRGLAWECVTMPWLAVVAAHAGSALVNESRQLPTGTLQTPGDAASAEAVWVPARNCVFVSVGASYAEAYEASVVLAGFNREEAVTFADNSTAFVSAASSFLQFGTKGKVRVRAPVQELDKRDIVAQARRLGVPLEQVWSCYSGDAVPCGQCESCLRSERAMVRE